LAIWIFPYARPQGLGRAMKDATTWRQALLATVLAVAAALATLGPLRGGLALLVTLLALLGVARFTLTRIPGLTGDSYGMIAEVCEAVVLLLFAGGLAGI
jgi:adenosylcobinamide-GDP ribazoletransferase